jgi:hypothetical protein
LRFRIGEPLPAPLVAKLIAVRLQQAFPGSGDRAQAGLDSQEEGSMPDRNQPPRQRTSAAGSGRAALDTALAYHRAWTSHDFDKAMTYIAEDIVCQAPAGRLDGAAAFRGFMEPFVQILTSSSLIAAFGDDDKAVVMYDTDTVPVKDAPGAECVTVRDGKITQMRIIFDRLPFDEARRAATPG